jgi:esterase/lipase superfamily enzyme
MLIDFFRKVFGNNPENPLTDPCGHNVHIMAHSMGNRVLENMMLKLTNNCLHVTTLFKQLIMVGADVNWTCLEEPQPLYRIGEIAERITVYNNRNDGALFISETSKNAFNRLGKYGPRDINKTPSHVYFIDVTDAKGNPPGREQIIHHWYYQNNPNVIKDIHYVLSGVPSGEIDGRYLTSDSRRYRLK